MSVRQSCVEELRNEARSSSIAILASGLAIRLGSHQLADPNEYVIYAGQKGGILSNETQRISEPGRLQDRS